MPYSTPLAQTINGFGTKLYGRRDQKWDGSFWTTKWVVFFWIPLIPLRSYRIKYLDLRETTLNVVSESSHARAADGDEQHQDSGTFRGQ